MHALDVIVRNTRASSSIPRRASDVATRSLAQRHYQDATHGAQAIAAPQGPVPLPHSISFSPPVQQYFMQGGLQRCADSNMRKAPSSFDVQSAADAPCTGPAHLRSEPAGLLGMVEGTVGKASLQSLSDAIPEGQPFQDGPVASADVGLSAHSLSLSPLSELVARGGEPKLPPMRMFTFLRLTKDLIQPNCSGHWMHFMSRMRPQAPRSLYDGL
jgi:hypothetical protein